MESNDLVRDLLHFSTMKEDLEIKRRFDKCYNKKIYHRSWKEWCGLSKRQINYLISGFSNDHLLKNMRTSHESDDDMNEVKGTSCESKKENWYLPTGGFVQ